MDTIAIRFLVGAPGFDPGAPLSRTSLDGSPTAGGERSRVLHLQRAGDHHRGVPADTHPKIQWRETLELIRRMSSRTSSSTVASPRDRNLLISLMAGECRVGTEVAVANLPNVCSTAAEGVLSPSSRTYTVFGARIDLRLIRPEVTSVDLSHSHLNLSPCRRAFGVLLADLAAARPSHGFEQLVADPELK